ncbi:hypothetical protein ACFFS4_28610 [Kutzneria kofuensis]|uniref:Uncharacterized protein n=1 Tax=Kutzneria kofuensis TaxID=103725 RepID=A0A7W9KNX5_9PSEU|nr:hypothetical protein [Kutzneria kofuensis]MBB5895294.1 hypothetical protein [Kutzneria kofuensis]
MDLLANNGLLGLVGGQGYFGRVAKRVQQPHGDVPKPRLSLPGHDNGGEHPLC